MNIIPNFYRKNVALPTPSEQDEQERKRKDDPDPLPQKLSVILRELTHSKNIQHHVTYKSYGTPIFRDEGRALAVLDQSASSLAATLAVAQQKFGSKLTLTGSEDFKRKAVESAVMNNLNVKFADPVLEMMRVKMVEQQHQLRVVEKRTVEAGKTLRDAQPKVHKNDYGLS